MKVWIKLLVDAKTRQVPRTVKSGEHELTKSFRSYLARLGNWVMLQTPAAGLLDPEWNRIICTVWVAAIAHLATLSKSALLAHPPELLVRHAAPHQQEQPHKHRQVPVPHCGGWTKSKSGKF